ncbi:MAG TPA: DHA2 family efflux MFS transporter permease subunit [Ignavibacteriaceae bacterium]|nr:DHA2 family efflux MFS transporter permease subunit [Ignavibacteriaceae bacterium]
MKKLLNPNINGKTIQLSNLNEHPSYKWFVLANVMLGTFMAVLDATIVNVGLTKMTAAFGTSVDKIEWVLTAYLLVFAVMLPSSGWIADHFGYKRTYFLGMLLFTLGSLLCSLSWDENVLILFRIIQGAGAGFIMPVGMAITTREFPPEQRGTALGFWGIASAASVSLGPMLGGYLIDNFSWHAIFDINVPVGIIALVVTIIIQREYKTEHVRKFDLIGFISMTVFLTSLLLALADGNAAWNTGGWTSNFIIGCFVISFIGFVIFIVTEFTVEHPIVDLRLLKDRNFGIANLMMFIFGMGLFGSTFLLPLYLQESLNYTAFQAGLVFFPIGIIQAFISPIAGRLTDKSNPRIPVLIGIIFTALSFFYYTFLSLTSEHSQIMMPLYFRGLGLGMIFIPLSAIALLDMPKEKMAQASGLFNTIRQIGGSFGVAIFGTLLTQRINFHANIYGQVTSSGSPEYQHVLINLQHFIQNTVGGAGKEVMMKANAMIVQNLTTQAFIQGINDDFLLSAIVTASLVIPLIFLKVSKKKKTDKVQIIE